MTKRPVTIKPPGWQDIVGVRGSAAFAWVCVGAGLALAGMALFGGCMCR